MTGITRKHKIRNGRREEAKVEPTEDLYNIDSFNTGAILYIMNSKIPVKQQCSINGSTTPMFNKHLLKQ